MDRRTKATLNRDKASRLNETLAVGAAQARYSDDGHWYAALSRFPAALFDAKGYVLFETEQEYRTSPYLHIGKQISVPKPGISKKRFLVMCLLLKRRPIHSFKPQR